jgi:hypothetical protein
MSETLASSTLAHDYAELWLRFPVRDVTTAAVPMRWDKVKALCR